MTFTIVKIIEIDDASEIVTFERQDFMNDFLKGKFIFEKRYNEFENVVDISELKDNLNYMFEIDHSESFEPESMSGDSNLEKLKMHLSEVRIIGINRLNLLSDYSNL